MILSTIKIFFLRWSHGGDHSCSIINDISGNVSQVNPAGVELLRLRQASGLCIIARLYGDFSVVIGVCLNNVGKVSVTTRQLRPTPFTKFKYKLLEPTSDEGLLLRKGQKLGTKRKGTDYC